MKDFKDKVIWITGASSGLGKFMAFEFAKSGAKLALSARRTNELEHVLEKVMILGGQGVVVPCDIQDESAIEQAITTITGHFGGLDVAIANAGFGVSGKIEQLSADDWKRQLDINVVGLALTAKHALPYLRTGKGRLVLIGSVAAYIPSPGTGAYGA